MAVPPDFDCGLVQRVLVRARVDHGNRGHLFWITRDKPSYDNKRSIQFWLHPGDSFRTYTIEVGEHDQWDGRITGIRLDPIDKPGMVEIDSVAAVCPMRHWNCGKTGAGCWPSPPGTRFASTFACPERPAA